MISIGIILKVTNYSHFWQGIRQCKELSTCNFSITVPQPPPALDGFIAEADKNVCLTRDRDYTLAISKCGANISTFMNSQIKVN